jgi:hypothetical protein
LRHHLTGEAYTADFDALTAHDAAAQAAHAHDELGLPEGDVFLQAGTDGMGISIRMTRAIAGALFLFPEEQASRTRVAKINNF